MKGTVHNEAERAMVNYLLGGLTEAEQTQFEDSYFSDDAQFEQLQIVKQELVDAYVRGHLAPAERELFERNFLKTPEARQQVAFAQALRETLRARSATATSDPNTQPVLHGKSWLANWSPFKWLLVPATALALLACAWLYRENQRLRTDLHRAQTALAASQQQAQALAEQLANARVQPTATPELLPPAPQPGPLPPLTPKLLPALPAVVLLSAARSPSVPEVHVPPGPARLPLRLVLSFDPGSSGCAVVLRRPNGPPEQRSRLQAHPISVGLAVQWDILTANLQPGDYEVLLTPVKSTKEPEPSIYSFRVVR